MSATGFHPEPSAKAPWTRTIVLTAAYAGDDAAIAAPVRRARIKRFMVKLRDGPSISRPDAVSWYFMVLSPECALLFRKQGSLDEADDIQVVQHRLGSSF